MTQHTQPDSSPTRSVWTLLSRTVRLSYGARRKAADALQEAQDTRRSRAEAAALLTAVSATPPGAAPVATTPTGGPR